MWHVACVIRNRKILTIEIVDRRSLVRSKWLYADNKSLSSRQPGSCHLQGLDTISERSELAVHPIQYSGAFLEHAIWDCHRINMQPACFADLEYVSRMLVVSMNVFVTDENQ